MNQPEHLSWSIRAAVMNRDRFAASIIEKSLMIFVIDPARPRRHPGRETFSDSRLPSRRIVPGQ
jgi:hypothetical protein